VAPSRSASAVRATVAGRVRSAERSTNSAGADGEGPDHRPVADLALGEHPHRSGGLQGEDVDPGQVVGDDERTRGQPGRAADPQPHPRGRQRERAAPAPPAPPRGAAQQDDAGRRRRQDDQEGDRPEGGADGADARFPAGQARRRAHELRHPPAPAGGVVVRTAVAAPGRVGAHDRKNRA
jgi:hypothetical protein